MKRLAISHWLHICLFLMPIRLPMIICLITVFALWPFFVAPKISMAKDLEKNPMTGVCTTHRAYSFETVEDQPAWASVVGNSDLQQSSSGTQLYKLVVNQQQVTCIQEALLSGCIPQIEFAIRVTTSILGAGSAWYKGRAVARLNGAMMGPPVDEQGEHPLPNCQTLVCQQTVQHYRSHGSFITPGSMFTLEGLSWAIAEAGGTSTGDQAHADWRIQFPVLLIPIP
jgi:hypothetical protein